MHVDVECGSEVERRDSSDRCRKRGSEGTQGWLPGFWFEHSSKWWRHLMRKDIFFFLWKIPNIYLKLMGIQWRQMDWCQNQEWVRESAVKDHCGDSGERCWAQVTNVWMERRQGIYNVLRKRNHHDSIAGGKEGRRRPCSAFRSIENMW